MLSPRLVELNRDAFVCDDATQSTVDLAAHRGESRLTTSTSAMTSSPRRRNRRRPSQPPRVPSSIGPRAAGVVTGSLLGTSAAQLLFLVSSS